MIRTGRGRRQRHRLHECARRRVFVEKDRVAAVVEVQPGVIQQINELTVEIEGEGKPAMVAESLSRTYLDSKA